MENGYRTKHYIVLGDLNWKFNKTRPKYRGSGAGEKQKARM